MEKLNKICEITLKKCKNAKLFLSKTKSRKLRENWEKFIISLKKRIRIAKLRETKVKKKLRECKTWGKIERKCKSEKNSQNYVQTRKKFTKLHKKKFKKEKYKTIEKRGKFVKLRKMEIKTKDEREKEKNLQKGTKIG